MNEELARLKRRVRRLEQSGQNWKKRVAQKQDEIRRLRIDVRDLGTSRQLWKQRWLDSSDPPHDEPPSAGLPAQGSTERAAT